MPNYIQTFENGKIHTISQAPNAFKEIPVNILEVPDFNEWYSGAHYDGETIAKLTPEGPDQAAINQEIALQVKWLDVTGEIVPRNGLAVVSCGDQAEEIQIMDGIGALTFESAEPGEHLIIITAHGCRAEKKVKIA